MAKAILVIDIKNKGINLEDVKYAIDYAFSPDDLVVEDAMDYPFEGTFRSDYLSVLHDTECLLSSNYGDREFTKEEISTIAMNTADKVCEGYVAEEVNNTIEECLNELVGEYKYFVVGIDSANTTDPKYWQDRWDIIEAGSSEEAIAEHLRNHSCFYRNDEKPCVKVLKVFTSKEWIEIPSYLLSGFKQDVNDNGCVINAKL